MLSRTITARGAGCSSRGWSSDCKPATQTTPNAPEIRHASASLRPHTAHPATRRMQILVDRNEPGPLRRAHAPAQPRPAGTTRLLKIRQEKLMVLPPGPSLPHSPRCPVKFRGEGNRLHFSGSGASTNFRAAKMVSKPKTAWPVLCLTRGEPRAGGRGAACRCRPRRCRARKP